MNEIHSFMQPCFVVIVAVIEELLYHHFSYTYDILHMILTFLYSERKYPRDSYHLCNVLYNCVQLLKLYHEQMAISFLTFDTEAAHVGTNSPSQFT